MKVKYFDFSEANTSEEARIEAVTKIASVCYANNSIKNKLNLYNRLETESMGLPSSSFEFVPILIPKNVLMGYVIESKKLKYNEIPHTIKYGLSCEDGKYILTNLRAFMNDVSGEFTKKFFNTDKKEIAIIKENFFVFRHFIDIPTRTQMIRHRASYQELSRRYVDDKRKPISFYIPDNGNNEIYQRVYDKALEAYKELREKGVSKQQARYVLPQGAMTDIWSAWQKPQLESFLKLRLSSHAQPEIREMAKLMKNQIK